MIDERKLDSVLKSVDFELSIDMLKGCLNESQAKALMSWIERWKVNLRQLQRLRIDNADYMCHVWELDEDDSRYNPDDGMTVCAKDGSPEETVKVAKMVNEFNAFGDSLPIMEFSREELYGEG